MGGTAGVPVISPPLEGGRSESSKGELNHFGYNKVTQNLCVVEIPTFPSHFQNPSRISFFLADCVSQKKFLSVL